MYYLIVRQLSNLSIVVLWRRCMKHRHYPRLAVFVTLFGLLTASPAVYLSLRADGHRICRTHVEVYTPQPVTADSIRFAIIGDYGTGNESAQQVAELVASWNPQFIVTVGDNNYPEGSGETIDTNVGQFYSAFIGSYAGDYGQGATTNNFYPALGNHDWRTDRAQPYLDYFTLPGNERYYDVVRGPVHLFILSSHRLEPDGRDADSIQAQWLQPRVTASTAAFQLVFAHHPPYSSVSGDETPSMRWPFAEWGVDAVFSGHAHAYERIERGGLPYINNGLGGASSLYMFEAPLAEGSQIQYDCNYGAVLVDADTESMTVRFVTIEGVVVDRFTIHSDPGTAGASGSP